MKNFILGIILIALAGCASTPAFYLKPDTLLAKYQRIAILPFTEANESHDALIYDILAKELQRESTFQVVGDPARNKNLMNEMEGVERTWGVVDFSVSPHGEERREKIEHEIGVDAIVLGSLFIRPAEISLYVQVVDLDNGQMIVSLHREEKIKKNNVAQAVAAAAQEVARQLISLQETSYFLDAR
jgi:hypothetical protein